MEVQVKSINELYKSRVKAHVRSRKGKLERVKEYSTMRSRKNEANLAEMKSNPPPRSLMKQIVDKLKYQGFKVDSREKSAGALKVWLKPPKGETNPLKYAQVGLITGNLKPSEIKEVGGHKYMTGPGYEIGLSTMQNDDWYGLVVAVYAGTMANEYRMGLDV